MFKHASVQLIRPNIWRPSAIGVRTRPCKVSTRRATPLASQHVAARSVNYTVARKPSWNANMLTRSSRRTYSSDAIEETEPILSDASDVIVEPLRWDSRRATPNLLSRRDIEGIDQGVNVQEMLELAKSRVRQTLAYSFKMGPDYDRQGVRDNARILVVYDTHCLLTRILAQAYGSALDSENSLMVDFESTSVPQLKATIDTMKEGDMVVLVQSSGFRLNDYRLRIELFKVGIKNLEHAHLNMMPNSQIRTYIETMSFAPTEETLKLAHGLKHLMDTEQRFVVRSIGGAECVYDCGLEPSLLNIGDYTGMKGVGGTFPVGEVFSEPKDLEKVNGEFSVFGYPDRNFEMQHLCKPFKISIRKGQLVEAHDAPKSFLEILDAVRGAEAEEGGGILIREFGVGLNTAIGRNAPLQNVTAFERQAGFHISLGRKHTVFKKSGISHKRSRFHIDVFVDLDEIQMGDKVVFKNGQFLPL